ncbi:amidohydrolase [Hymenobacter sp. YC55]|uniref:amidohydrolase n=1 Tax=Hymenobacter sp. YC55 TaxID=3034019 RepID=UPI0023FA37E7|nr:amidohydrolase [Hymenobacter sp. YC55]MDF7814884.1 amidohydrolase [Hymenobacter sp. YC55]
MKEQALKNIEAGYSTYSKIALQIWKYAEVGYKETQSSALLQQTLREQGFDVQAGAADIPTAFIATYGSGKPVIGLLAEYDALPGLSQQATPEKSPIAGQDAGHGCGHNLFGTASVAAGIELKKLLAAGKIKGTVRVYGTPAEEGGSGKVYMVRAGLFKDVDAVVHWHPGSENRAMMNNYLANSSAKFRFHGISAHAAMAPERGRSALDAVEAMNHMVNLMREHIPQETRIHYVITSGGKAPNVVPDYAEVYYYVRHPKKDDVKQIFERVVKAAEGAALGTGTTMDYEIIGGTHDLLLNETLARALQRNLNQVGGVIYTAQEADFGRKIQASLGFTVPPLTAAATVGKFETREGGGSTDVGDVSYVVPTVGLEAATWIPGTPAHSWQAVACDGTEVGTKGMMVAAKTMALTAIDMFSMPDLLLQAKNEFKNDVGSYTYKPLLGDRKPALNYRD